MYPKYKSPLGYSTGDNNIDAYGVDHSGFSNRDEIEYQIAREARENQIIQNYNNQGITENYPQYTTNFWGSSPENNYGFGTSKIHDNIENMQNQTNWVNNSNSTQWGMNNEQSQVYNPLGNSNSTINSGLNNSSLFSPNNMQSLNLDASAALYPQQNSSNTYSQPYQVTQNTNPNMASDVASLNTMPEYQLGMLSAKGESDNGKNIFNDCNADETGGCSYGTYQIETKKGTMKDYLNYLNQNPAYQDFYTSLQEAGGYNAALLGTDIFKGKWKELSNNSDFLKSQHDFIVASKLNTALKLVKDIKGLDFDKRSPVVKDVLLSTAAQHGQGGASTVFHNALGNDASNFTDEEIINKIYNERKKVDKYFSRSSIDTQSKLKNIRFPKENAKALELLKRYQH